LDEGGRAGTGLPDYGDTAARGDLHGDVVEHAGAAGVGVVDVVEADGDRAVRQGGAGGSRIRDVGFGVEDPQDPSPARDRVLGFVEDLGGHRHGGDER